MKNVHYLGFYSTEEMCENFAVFPSAIPKMEFLIQTLKEIGFNVKVVSSCQTKTEGMLFKGMKCIEDGVEYLFFPSYKSKNQYFNKICILFFMCELFLYIMFNIKKGETLIVYHSMFYLRVIQVICFFKSIDLIMEVEEFYFCNTMDKAILWKNKEMKYLAKKKKFIFINECMADEMKADKYCIYYGPYTIKEYAKRSIKRENDALIRVVYAGSVENIRKAAFITAETARYLPDNYRISVIGFGDEVQIRELEQLICKINTELGFQKVSYHLPLYHEQYFEYMKQFDIGISCHYYEEKYKDAIKYTFPSKILTYLNLGLRVVTPKLECLEKSRLDSILFYSDTERAYDLAMAIQKIDMKTTYNVSDVMKELKQEFVDNLKKLIEV